MVVTARQMVDDGTVQNNSAVQALNALGYDEAAQHVYGMKYPDWKARHQKKATDAQLQAFQASQPIQAKHDKALLAKRGDKPTISKKEGETASSNNNPVLSNVCCQDVEQVVAKQASTPKDTRTVPPYQPPPLPKLESPIKLAVLTVSDRASKDEYATGDLSGPAVVREVQQLLGSHSVEFLPTVIVPDDQTAIQSQLQAWTAVDIILTTGGTGMSPRDVTPEATRAVLDTECAGLMGFVATECSRLQPLASLTRGTAGILHGRTMVANLPGNPKAVGEIVPILLPLLVHAVQDIKA